MPDDDPRFLKPIIIRGQSALVSAQLVCLTLINRLRRKDYDFADVSGMSLTVAFDEADPNRLEARLRLAEDRFKENLSNPDAYKPVTFAYNFHREELNPQSRVWELAKAMKENI